jgi:hypothetical protein
VGRLIAFALAILALLPPPSAAADATPPPPPPAPPPAPAAKPVTGYSFTVGTPLLYAYELRQEVSWESAGDKLAFNTTLLWTMALLPKKVESERVELDATIIRVKADHTGPGSNHHVDSGATAEVAGGDDPLLGHLLALAGVTLTVVLDPRTGAVAEVRGGDEVAKRIAKRAPSPFGPDQPSPLAAQAAATFSSAALARQWSEMLARPPGTDAVQAVALGPPLAGTVERRWQGSTYTLALPAGTDHLAGRLLTDPVSVNATLTALAGKGQVTCAQGVPGESTGELRFTLTLDALTQPVAQRHHLQWRLWQITPH